MKEGHGAQPCFLFEGNDPGRDGVMTYEEVLKVGWRAGARGCVPEVRVCLWAGGGGVGAGWGFRRPGGRVGGCMQAGRGWDDVLIVPRTSGARLA